MDFFKEFSKQISNRARTAAEKSKEGIEVSRLNAEMKAAEASLEGLYTRLGKASYALVTGQGNQYEVEELTVLIRAALRRMEELTAARESLREMKRCQSCGALFPREARFCSACGKKLAEDPPRPEPVEPGEYCENCGAMREEGEARCPVCGADYTQPEIAPEPVATPDAPPPIPGPEEPDGAME